MKNPNAQALGSLGGKATARKMTKEQLRERAMKGVAKRLQNKSKKYDKTNKETFKKIQ